MSRINDRQPLFNRINTVMMTYVACHKHICSFFYRRHYRRLSRPGRNSKTMYIFFHISIHFHTSQFQFMLHIETTFFQCHFPLKHSDSSDSFFCSVFFHCHIKHICFLNTKNIFCQLRHAKHIIICVHCIIRNVILKQLYNTASYKIFICHSLHWGKYKRMMRNKHISS